MRPRPSVTHERLLLVRKASTAGPMTGMGATLKPVMRNSGRMAMRAR